MRLIGDEAHPVLPSLGQGDYRAIEDAFELAKQLAILKTVGRLPF
jgi:2-polyprenyl-6-methoxyphenol hydroxylase-like FAD-dependent oxidoreductase